MSSERIRILHFLTTENLAGTELSTCQVVQVMDKERFDVDVAFLMNGGPVSQLLTRSGIRVHTLLGSTSLWGALRRLLKLVRAEEFQLVHLYGFKTSLLGRFVFKIFSPRSVIVQGIRGQHLTQTIRTDSPLTRVALLVERAFSPLIDYYVANSEGAIRFLTAHGLPAEKFVWIRSGIDTNKWQMEPRLEKKMPLIACVARFHPVKGHVDLIEALVQIYQEGIPFQCVLAGNGSLLSEVRALVGNRGLDGSVSFPGELDREGVRTLLSEADIFVLPSAWEGLPRSVMEAMAAGLPVVGTDVSGTNELVENGVTGLLVDSGDRVALARALASMLEDREMRVEMGRRGQRRIQAGFDLHATTRRLEDFYKSAVSRKAEQHYIP